MNRRAFLSGVALGAFAPPLATQALPAGKTARVGFLFFTAVPVASPEVDALMLGLRELGYTEGRNLLIERRAADGHAERLPELAAELVRSQVELIMIFGPQPLDAARNATKTIPLVMIASSSDPVAEGVALSLARPGGNTTGLTYAVSSDRFGKQLELLKSAVGQMARVAVLWELDLEIFRRFWAAPLADAGRMLGLEIQEPVRVTDEQELPGALTLMKQRRADAILVATGGPLNVARARVGEIAIQHRLPKDRGSGTCAGLRGEILRVAWKKIKNWRGRLSSSFEVHVRRAAGELAQRAWPACRSTSVPPRGLSLTSTADASAHSTS